MTPRIGITTSFEADEQRLSHAYVRAVADAGGLPILLPMLVDPGAARALADLIDGLVMTGGPAVTCGLVGNVPADLSACDPLRERADRLLLEAFLETPKPFLGICYGMQLLNATLGGTVYADVERQRPGSTVHASQRGGTTHPLHPVPGTHLAYLLGEAAIEVNTFHVQAIETTAPGLRVSANAPDGVIEAVESEDGRLLGMQFHPERMGASARPLFRHLTERARALSPVFT